MGETCLRIDVTKLTNRVMQPHIPAAKVVDRQAQVTSGDLGILVATAQADFSVDQVIQVATDHQRTRLAPAVFLGNADGAMFQCRGQ